MLSTPCTEPVLHSDRCRGGLAGVLLTMPSLQIAMKTVGSLYLLWLGRQIAGRGAPNLAGASSRPSSFAAGV